MFSRAALRTPGFVGSTMRPSMPVLAMAKQLHVSSRSVLLPALVGINAKQEQPNSKLLHLVVGAGMLTIISQNSYDYSESVGKKRKKDSVLVDDMYEVDFIAARRLVKGDPEYLIHWKGFDEKHDTWEPLANLCGLEPDLATFEATCKQKKANEATTSLPSRWRETVPAGTPGS